MKNYQQNYYIKRLANQRPPTLQRVLRLRSVNQSPRDTGKSARWR